MCIKSFKGYICGHCSLPEIQRCPLAEQDPRFPVCGFQAERPEFKQEWCPGCWRIVWNQHMLTIEAAHREAHKNGLCACEVVFTDEDRHRLEAGNRGEREDREIEEASRSGSGTPQEIHQRKKVYQEAYKYVDNRLGGSPQQQASAYKKRGYQGSPFAPHPAQHNPNYRPFITSRTTPRTYMRWHPSGEQYTGTLYDGTTQLANSAMTSENQKVLSASSANTWATGETEPSNQSLANNPPLQGVSFVVREQSLNNFDIPASPISVSIGMALLTRPRSSPN